MNRLPAEAGDAAKAAVEAVDHLLSQLPRDEFTTQMMKIAENPPGRADVNQTKRPKKKS